MSEREEILAELVVIRRMLTRGGGVLGTVLLVIIGVGINDHFDQRELRKESDYMRPKVEVLWHRLRGIAPEPMDASAPAVLSTDI